MDMSTYIRVPFNLEIMKLSAYYKNKREVVVLSPSFTPERHQQYFMRKDYDDEKYPPNLMRISNVKYGGLAFSDNVYTPLPIEIERCKPDTSIYSNMEGTIRGTSHGDQIYKNMAEGEHCRLSLDGKTIWPEYRKQFKFLPSARHLIFHDYDLGKIEGSFEEVQNILSGARTDGWATRVGMKFPVQVSTGKDLLNWASLKPNQIFYGIRFNGVIDNPSFMKYVGAAKEKAIFSQMEYNIGTSSYTADDFVKLYLQQIFRQVLISRSFRVRFSLKYDDDFFFDPRWARVIDLINFFHGSYLSQPTSRYLKIISDDTMFDFVSNMTDKPYRYYKGNVITRQEAREIFSFVRDNHPSLFKDFYECSCSSLQGGLV